MATPRKCLHPNVTQGMSETPDLPEPYCVKRNTRHSWCTNVIAAQHGCVIWRSRYGTITMPKSLRKHELTAPRSRTQRPGFQPPKKCKNSRYSWLPRTMPYGRRWAPILSGSLILKQLDSIDELIKSTPSAQAAIVLWDARNHPSLRQCCRACNLHSSRFAVVALDDAQQRRRLDASDSTSPGRRARGLPIVGHELSQRARQPRTKKSNSRLALLGDGSGAARARPVCAEKTLAASRVVIGGVLVAAVRRLSACPAAARPRIKPPPRPPCAAQGSASSCRSRAAAAVKSPADADEKVDALIEKARASDARPALHRSARPAARSPSIAKC